MALVKVESPSIPAVSEETVWAHLRLDIDEAASPAEPVDADYVRGLIEAAIGEVDGADGLLGRALITQRWAISFDRWPRVIELPLPPLQAVETIQFVDPAGVLQTMAPSTYSVSGVGAACKAEVAPARGTWWPTVRDQREAIVIRFRCGYGDTPADVPAPIQQAIVETVATRYAFRETVGSGSIFTRIPAGAQAALDNYRIWAF